jgi:twitching motility protein PilT
MGGEEPRLPDRPDRIHDPELDRLVRELNLEREGIRDGEGEAPSGSATGDFRAGRPGEPAPGLPPTGGRVGRVGEDDPLVGLQETMVRSGASDLLLVPGHAPTVRVDGTLRPVEGADALDGDELTALFRPHLTPRARHQLETVGAADFSLRLAGGPEVSRDWRFRINLHRQGGEPAAAVRALPREVPSLADLHLPASLGELVASTRGLVLVCGPTGSGKSSTLAALVHRINRTARRHVITIEDPVEYEHRSDRCLVEQVEVGRDVRSFADALRAALRQDPDVILVGEMRDLETVRIALTAAETGHLVLATLHTHDSAQAIHRIVDVFPEGDREQIRHQLALSLHAVVTQQLVPRADGRGRLPAVELLLASHAVRYHVRNNQLQKLYNEITLGKRRGMMSLEESLADLVARGLIDVEEARIRSARPDELESLLR